MNIGVYKEILKDCNSIVKLVAVSKTRSEDDILSLYNEGQIIFGENKVKELVSKFENLPKNIDWHFIGHLQKNKVKYIASFVNLIHAVDSDSLLKEINKRAIQNNRIISCLIQFHIAEENTKFGLNLSDIDTFFSKTENYKNIKITGVMGMATNTSDKKLIANEFENLNNIFTLIKKKYFKDVDSFKEISMGMSNDYQTAIEKGSTMIRVGSSIFKT